MKLMIKCYHFSIFLFFYVKEVLISNVKVAIDVVSPKPRISPGIVAVKLTKLNENGVTLLANFVSMTPGTLALDYDSENGELWIHSMYLEEEESFVSYIQNQYENPIAKFQ